MKTIFQKSTIILYQLEAVDVSKGKFPITFPYLKDSDLYVYLIVESKHDFKITQPVYQIKEGCVTIKETIHVNNYVLIERRTFLTSPTEVISKTGFIDAHTYKTHTLATLYRIEEFGNFHDVFYNQDTGVLWCDKLIKGKTDKIVVQHVVPTAEKIFTQADKLSLRDEALAYIKQEIKVFIEGFNKDLPKHTGQFDALSKTANEIEARLTSSMMKVTNIDSYIENVIKSNWRLNIENKVVALVKDKVNELDTIQKLLQKVKAEAKEYSEKNWTTVVDKLSNALLVSEQINSLTISAQTFKDNYKEDLNNNQLEFRKYFHDYKENEIPKLKQGIISAIEEKLKEFGEQYSIGWVKKLEKEIKDNYDKFTGLLTTWSNVKIAHAQLEERTKEEITKQIEEQIEHYASAEIMKKIGLINSFESVLKNKDEIMDFINKYHACYEHIEHTISTLLYQYLERHTLPDNFNQIAVATVVDELEEGKPLNEQLNKLLTIKYDEYELQLKQDWQDFMIKTIEQDKIEIKTINEFLLIVFRLNAGSKADTWYFDLLYGCATYNILLNKFKVDREVVPQIFFYWCLVRLMIFPDEKIKKVELMNKLPDIASTEWLTFKNLVPIEQWYENRQNPSEGDNEFIDKLHKDFTGLCTILRNYVSATGYSRTNLMIKNYLDVLYGLTLNEFIIFIESTIQKFKTKHK